MSEDVEKVLVAATLDTAEWREKVETILEQIGDYCDAASMPPGYAGLMRDVRHQVAARLFCYQLEAPAVQMMMTGVAEEYLRQSAINAWHAAAILVEMDPESPDRLRGEETLTGFPDIPAADRRQPE